MVFGSHLSDPYGRGGDGEKLMVAQESSLSDQSTQQSQLRVMAQGAVLMETARCKLRRTPAQNRSFYRTGV